MAKKHNILLYVLLVALVTLQVVLVNLNIALWIKIVVSLLIYAAVLYLLIWHTLKTIKKQKEKQKMEEEQKQQKPQMPTLLDIYAILKIAPQYNADGSLKDLYQLLGIEPEYDENGNRIPTIYEKLGINPKFNPNAQEIPFVVRIKNRTNSIIKLQAAPLPLIYISREQLSKGEKPKLPPPVLGGNTDEPKPPEFKKIPVVKPNKPAAKKPAKKPSVNYGASAQKVSVTINQKIKYSPIKEISSGSKTSLFDAGKPKDKNNSGPQISKVEVNKNGSNNLYISGRKQSADIQAKTTFQIGSENQPGI